MILDAVFGGSTENRCFPVAAYPSGITAPATQTSYPLFLVHSSSLASGLFSSPRRCSSFSSPQRFDLTLFSLLIIAIFDEFESKISKFEHMDKCLSVDYKYNIHFSGFRECAK